MTGGTYPMFVVGPCLNVPYAYRDNKSFKYMCHIVSEGIDPSVCLLHGFTRLAFHFPACWRLYLNAPSDHADFSSPRVASAIGFSILMHRRS